MRKLLYIMILVLAASCTDAGLTKSGLDPEKFVSLTDGKPTALYTLSNPDGMEVCITNYGGRIVSIMVPDRNGKMQDVVLGFDNIEDYKTIPSDFGAAIGRYANRINQGRFTLDGKEYQLPQNNFGHCLHGGPEGWQYKVYDVLEADDSTLTLALDSPDGDEGFPGNVHAEVKYTLGNDSSLKIEYSARTGRPTVINMTNHSYFNLSGNPSCPATDHLLYINADSYTPVDSTFMTTGEILPVEGTPMDFRNAKTVGKDIDADFRQLHNGRGYDHNWVLNTAGDMTKAAAVLYSPESGIKLDVYTDEPGIQVYTGNFLDGTVIGKHGVAYPFRASVCLETQHYPDSPNKPEWPSVVLRPGENYRSTCIFVFSTVVPAENN
ncbi:MAG TPA: galactose mutarotase [Candidatus Cryptobacteroides intestinipullorum]|nr:galactose mutarotase [Candidatus Cryptobacteroides intestinipullorum]